MEDAHVALLVMVLAAVMVIVVVGAGTMWVYLGEVRRPDAPRDPRRTSEAERGDALPDSSRADLRRHDRAA